MFIGLRGFIVLAIFVGLHIAASAQPQSPQLATVEIYAYDSMELNKRRIGTGFFVDNAGTVATAYHVIEGARRLQIFDYGKGEYNPSMVKLDANHDLALLKLSTSSTSWLPLRETPPYPKDVQVFGNPRGVLNLHVPGWVSQDEYQDVEAVQLSDGRGERILREDAASFKTITFASPAIYGGISGGPILNSANEVVGILSGALNEGGTLAWGIPAIYLKRLIENPPQPRSLDDRSPWPQLPYQQQYSKSLITFVAVAEQNALRSHFVNVDITDIANSKIDWLLKGHPEGQVIFDKIPFTILSGDRAVLHTKNFDRPDFPVAFRLRINSNSITSLHFLLNGNWTPRGQIIGSVRISYADGPPQEVKLIGMQTIRETWMPKTDVFNAPFLPLPDGVIWNSGTIECSGERSETCPRVNWSKVYQQQQFRGATEAIGFLDRLSISTDPKRRIDEITISNNNWASGAGIILTALTLETSQQ